MGIYARENGQGMVFDAEEASDETPPDDVPDIEPDIRGAVTIRDQLAKHRENATCAECHRKIDPLGFALENFDAIGGWRNQYGKDQPIDASGKLPTLSRPNR